MINRYQVLVICGLLFFGSCKTETNNSTEKREPIIEPKALPASRYAENVTKKVEKIIAGGSFTTFQQLQMQKLDRIEENSEVKLAKVDSKKMTGNQMYYHLKERTMYIGSSYLCSQCPSIHFTNASGFIVSEEGVLVTNYHVVEGNENLNISAIFASDYEGNVYPVSKILSASQSNDLAVLQLDTKGKKLKFLPMATGELMGEDVYVMGHPFGNNFLMTKGIIARKFYSRRATEQRIAITAEFGLGSSGGPVVNNFGEVVGIVSGTQMLYTNGSSKKGDLQMIIKEAIPVSTVHSYFK